MSYDYKNCVVLNARMAARAVSRRYDRKLRKFGITAAQFGMLGALAKQGATSVTELAGELAMDRTTASRNLDLLARKGLVSGESGEKGNVRLCSLTENGHALVARLEPKWREEQEALRQLMPGQDLDGMLAMLKALSRL